MQSYRIYRMKEQPRQQFRWAPHTSGVTAVKAKDYEEGEVVEAAGVYAVWTALQQSPSPLRVGDVLATEDGRLSIYKYVGFEEARWVLPEVKSGLEAAPVAIGRPVEPSGAAELG
mgnify:CR=1 FL=1